VAQGVLEVGEKLPTEPQLQQEFSVSRTVIREAVNQLKARGILASRQGSGVYVNARTSSQEIGYDPHVVSSIASMVELIEAWRPIAVEIASLAAKRATQAQVATIRQKFAAIDIAVERGKNGLNEQLEFYKALAQGTNNRIFSQFFSIFERNLIEGLRITRGTPRRLSQYIPIVRNEQLKIVEAIAAHDVRAAREAALEHVRGAPRRLLEGASADRLARKPPVG
jgi:GntR family transcriptional repressor for pyruvate dehydrogenase complex